MVNVTVIRPFDDVVEQVFRKSGDTFEATEERAAQLIKRLPSGYVSVSETVEETTDYAKMTVAQLIELCGERGIEPPKKAKKAELVNLLEG